MPLILRALRAKPWPQFLHAAPLTAALMLVGAAASAGGFPGAAQADPALGAPLSRDAAASVEAAKEPAGAAAAEPSAAAVSTSLLALWAAAATLAAGVFATGWARSGAPPQEIEPEPIAPKAPPEPDPQAQGAPDDLAALLALGRLSAGVAHDVNNTLATIQYAVELAATNEGAEARRFHDIALAAVARGAGLTGRLVDLAKRGPEAAEARPVGETFEIVAAVMRPLLDEDVVLRVEAPHVACIAGCDQGRLENALVNLILNSRDAIRAAGGRGAVTLRARSAQSVEGAPRVIIEVADDGPGLDEATRRRTLLLASGAPAEEVAALNEAGPGLGLTTIADFVHEAGGALEIAASKTGSIVSLHLPSIAAAAPIEARAASDGAGAGSIKGARVLLLEDDEPVRAMMAATLSGLGCAVVVARAGPEALAAARAEAAAGRRCDAAVIDVATPGGLDGFEVAQRLRRLWPELAAVFVSGHAGAAEAAADAGERGAPLLAKPSDAAALRGAVARALAASKQPIESAAAERV
ncbi:MAG: response regulator [Pseudomonadota bacterium]